MKDMTHLELYPLIAEEDGWVPRIDLNRVAGLEGLLRLTWRKDSLVPLSEKEHSERNGCSLLRYSPTSYSDAHRPAVLGAVQSRHVRYAHDHGYPEESHDVPHRR